MEDNYKRLVFALFMAVLLGQEASGDESYVISFQSEIEGSFAAGTNSWIELATPISSTKEFTVCNWLKIKFFGRNIAACTWAYCTVPQKNPNERIKCSQICFDADSRTASRNLILTAWIHLEKGQQYFQKLLDNYNHRTWFHLCWSLSTISGISRFYLNGNMFLEDEIDTTENDWAFSGSDQMLITSLIFGQEPDSFRGGFDRQQAYLGSLAEFNVWNYTLKDDDIIQIAKCRSTSQGNIASWKESIWNLNAISKRNDVELSELCIEKPQYLIFPWKSRYQEARKLCEIHGGALALPRSENDTSAILDILSMHQKSCLGTKKSPQDSAVWIGAKRFNYTWYEVGESYSYESIGSPLTYAKITIDVNYKNTKCAYIRNDGSWIDIRGDFGCQYTSLCTVCELKIQPVFTLKGLCGMSDVDWNYYLDMDNEYQIKRYEGYKNTDIVYDNEAERWKIVAKEGNPPSFEASSNQNELTTLSHPIGRTNWSYQDPICQVTDVNYTFTFSNCGIPSHFTCDSGHCVDIQNRCDEKVDCLDGSDEELCNLIEIPSSYSKANAPDSPLENSPMIIKIYNRIISIDSIDTINMIVTLTMELKFEWFDKRLTYSNPDINEKNLISEEQSKKIWTPLRNIIHENAIIGEIAYDGDFVVQINAITPGDLEANNIIENRLFNGSSNNLIGIQRMKAKYNCEFDSKKFPFDEHNCDIILRLEQTKNKRIHFMDDGQVLYDGKSIVGQFLIGQMSTEVKSTNDSSRNLVAIHVIRIYANQITVTFVPTLVLWLFGYSTLFIEPNEDGFSDRFIGAGTALLVIVTLLNAINIDLPKTSYMKYIDLWFMWHLISVFLMIAYHIVLNRLRSYFNTKNINKWKMISRINSILIFAFPFVNGIFYAIYFSHTL